MEGGWVGEVIRVDREGSGLRLNDSTATHPGCTENCPYPPRMHYRIPPSPVLQKDSGLYFQISRHDAGLYCPISLYPPALYCGRSCGSMCE